MLAMNYRGPFRVRVDRNRPDPKIEHPNDAIVRVTRSCICGSDLHFYHGLVPDTRPGMTFGHEFATAVGGIFGYSHTTGGYDGGQAEYVRVPYADIGPHIIPDWMDHDDAVLCTEYRLDFVRTYAQCEVYNFRSIGDPVLFLKKATEFYGADVCIDAVGCEAAGSALQTFTGRKTLMQAGSATALLWAISSVKKGGIVSIVGVYGPTFNMVPIGNVVNKGLTIRANQASVKRLLPKLISHRHLNYERVEQQPVDVEILRSDERPSVTSVFGTSTPPSV
jgi:threonine dehydrogenase-like Zn-dependent dehydrogenase